MTPREGLARAIALYGSEHKLGEAIGYTQAAIWRAVAIGRPSPEMAVNIEAVTRGKVTRAMLCPELFAKKAVMIRHEYRPGPRGPRPVRKMSRKKTRRAH